MTPRFDNRTREILFQHQLRPPVNVTALASGLGVRVWESDKLPKTVSGKLFLDRLNGGFNNFSIQVQSSDPLVRKRFTIAHEIGHFLLHRGLFKDQLVDDALYRSGLTTREEAEANRVAADILMPWHLLEPLSLRPPKDLADIFQVSEQAMKIRLEGKAAQKMLPALR